MILRFLLERALQASAYLPQFDGKRMAYLRLLKLLSIADREWLAETGESIMGDRACAMEYGPVLSNVYDFIKGNGSKAGVWDDQIPSEGYAIELVADPGRGELSKGIVNTLTEVTGRYRQLDDWGLAVRTHESPEWAQHFRPGGGSSSIPWQDILEAQGKAAMISSVKRDEAARQVFDEVFEPEAGTAAIRLIPGIERSRPILGS
jgi:uncharacterized phage-associated protein